MRNSWPVLLLLLSTFIYALILPPFEVADEPAHFAKAAQLASWAFPSVRVGSDWGAMIPLPLVKMIREWRPIPPGSLTTQRPLGRLCNGLLAPPADGGTVGFASFTYVGSYPSFFYFSQAVGLRLGALLGLAPLGQFYAGRLAGGLFAVSLILLGIRLIPFGKRTATLIACLPGVAGQLGTYSADSTIIAITFFASCLLVRGGSNPSSKLRWIQSGLVPLIILAKGVYLPIVFAGMGVREAWKPRHLIRMTIPIAFGLALFVFWFGILARHAVVVQSFVSHYTLLHVTAATPRQQMGFMEAHPFAALRAILVTIIERLPVYAIECIGRFGPFIVTLPIPVYILGALSVAGATVATRPGEPMPEAGQRILWLAIVLAVVILVHIALYMVASTLGESHVEGVQGRYFIPVLPLLGLTVRTRASAAAGRFLDITLPVCFFILTCSAATMIAISFWSW